MHPWVRWLSSVAPTIFVLVTCPDASIFHPTVMPPWSDGSFSASSS
jgi:hypothetical protein